MAIASLPWYDLPEIRDATDQLWRAVSAACREVGIEFAPDNLERELDYREQWGHPNLMFTQCCGYDVAVDAGRALRAIAAPCFDFEGCTEHFHSSFIVVRENDPAWGVADLRGRRAALNNVSSHSGANALRAVIAPFSRDGRFFSQVTLSGSHVASLQLLHDNLVDVACVDCVTWGLLLKHRPSALQGVRKIAQTPLAPVPPYVTSMRYGKVFARKLHSALESVMTDAKNRQTCEAMGIKAVAAVDNQLYDRILAFEQVAMEHEYYELPAPVGSRLSGRRPLA
ncbi:MAG: PhnD/SsuA/transferrin family substrate-binding protein [Planctomycetes bacterium]|nr:PhnD/SsuA/transferrin family substrate-binding protein [Planctomycetota bacterium]